MAKVSVNQDACIADMICISMAPEIFELGDDGKAHVKEGMEELEGDMVGKAKEAAEAMDRQEQREKKQEPVKKGVAMPSCIHGEGLLYCDPCCNTLWVYQRDKLSHLANYVEPLHTYAKEHVIA